MRKNLKVLMQFVLIILLIVSTTAQSSHRNQRSQQNDKPKEQGRTLGLVGPLFGLGFNSIVRPLLGSDVPFVPVNRPSSTSSQSDPYYGYGNYNGGYIPNFFNGYNYYGGYPFYRPVFPFFNVFRPQVYPGYYGGYAPNNGYGGQRPVYNSNSRPRPFPQRPLTGQQAAVSPALPATSSTTSPVAQSAQTAQIANLLGQLLGQQLRPLLNPGASSPAHDDPGIAPSDYHDKSFRNRYYRG